MSLSPGFRLGPYEIMAPLGAGGMGEVYRARDTKLGRDVALKILPDAFARDQERLARFEREARTLASLNHPHIAHIHGLEDSPSTRSGQAGTRALIMELVEGEELAALIARGPIQLEEAVAIARQIAEALDAAHSAGIVHRDLKPANVKVREDGTVKVLDFGLATGSGTKVRGQGSADSLDSPLNSPTIAAPAAMTAMGMILGTAAYMAPEQARGRAVDKRADIWAFGCVLYEMLSGRAAFEGETVTDLLGSIVKSEPDWTKLPANIPHRVLRVLQRCLQKDPARRLRDIGDAVAELEPGPAHVSAAPSPLPEQKTRQTKGLRPGPVTALLVVVTAAAATGGYFARPAPDARLEKFHLAIQEDGATIREPVISADGRTVVYVGRSRLRVQALDEWQSRELAGTEAAVRPFWSPDGSWIAYFRSEALLKVPAAGGPVVRVATLPAVQAPLSGNSGIWGEDGTITVSLAQGALLRVPSGGGEPTPVTLTQPDGVVDLHDLELLPGGALVATVHRSTGIDALGIIKDGVLRIVLETSNVRSPAYSPPGYLIFERRAPTAGLWAVPFSLDRLEVTGDPFLIGEGTEPTVARDGTLSFIGQTDNQARQLSWFSLDGQVGGRLAEPRDWSEGVAISRDGRRMLAAASDGIWAYDTESGSRSRITNGQTDITPNWVDADTMVFVRTLGSEPVVMIKSVGASADERVLARGARFPHVTADGRRVVFNQVSPDGGWRIAWIDLGQPSDIRRLDGAHIGARFPSVSSDGTLVAYISGEVGRDEVFLTRLPSGEGKWQLSNEGGGWTRFSPRGDAVVYRAPDGAFMSVPLSTTQGEVRIGQPKKLFDWGAGWMLFYDLARDGQRGVAATPVGKTTQVWRLSVVHNWQREFARD